MAVNEGPRRTQQKCPYVLFNKSGSLSIWLCLFHLFVVAFGIHLVGHEGYDTSDDYRGDESFSNVCKGNRLEALFTVALAMGLRQGEALGLRWEDVDWESGLLRVRH
ncbi:MAG TPA: hypothetical protein VKN18_25615 [Blastocatellia bacterium]|nr:hypothetical protein [Blastocatellia bacterium]